MKKEDNRGLSTVIATLLIILLVIVAVAIVWGVIRTIINRGSEDISLGKFTINLEILSVIQPRNETNMVINTNIKVKRNPGEGELEGIIFSIFDGKNTHLYEKRNITLNQLEIKTFVVDYTGKIVSVSIFPILKTSSGKTTTGGIADTYYYTGGDSGGIYIPTNCIINCVNKVCGDNGCGGICGICSGSTPYCVLGKCSAESGGEPDCSCNITTCIGTTCSDGLEGSCIGTLSPDCNNNQFTCGDSLNDCGICGECEEGSYCDGGICVVTCMPDDCTGKECGSNGCGGSCGWCEISYNISYTCNISGLCEMCTPDCSGGRNCGTALNGCGVCGECNETRGELCSLAGICVLEVFLNTGIVNSTWPISAGIYFDSDNLPKSGVSYTDYWVRLLGGTCLQIEKFVTPVIPQIYNMSYIKFYTSSSSIKAGDNYEIWKTYGACTL